MNMKKEGKTKRFKKIACGCLAAALVTAAAVPAPVTVHAAALKLNKTSATLTVGKKLTLKVKNAKKTASVKWTTSDRTVAAVSAKGVVTAKAAGKAVIKATVSKKTLKCKITVKNKAVNPDTDTGMNQDQNTDDVQNSDVTSDQSADAKDISALLAGKSYKGTAATPVGDIEALNLTFGADGTVAGSKINEATFLPEEFSGTYKAVLSGKKVTITVEADGKTFSEELTLASDDYTKLTAAKNIMGMDITVTVEAVAP